MNLTNSLYYWVHKYLLNVPKEYISSYENFCRIATNLGYSVIFTKGYGGTVSYTCRTITLGGFKNSADIAIAYHELGHAYPGNSYLKNEDCCDVERYRQRFGGKVGSFLIKEELRASEYALHNEPLASSNYLLEALHTYVECATMHNWSHKLKKRYLRFCVRVYEHINKEEEL